MFVPNFEPGLPPPQHHDCLKPFGLLQRSRGGEKGRLCRDHSYSSVLLRLLGWDGGQARSTFKNFVIFKSGLKWRVVFWRRGVFSLAWPSSEVESPSLSRGRSERIQKPRQTWVIGRCTCKTSFRGHKSCARFIRLVFVLRWVSQIKI